MRSASLPGRRVDRALFAVVMEAYVQIDEIVRMLTRSHHKVAGMLDGAREALLAIAGFPTAHWRQIWP